MKSISFEQYHKYASIAILLIIIFLSYLILKPFITAILGSIVLAYIFNPLYKFINKRIKNSTFSALLVISILIILVAMPIFFVVNSLIDEAAEINNLVRTSGAYSKLIEVKYIPEIISKATEYIISNASKFIISLPSRLLSLGIMFFILFYLLIQGEFLLKSITDKIPLEERQKDHLINKFRETVNALIYGLLITGIIQGVILAISFYIFHANSPILFGVIVFILALIPALGPAIVWLPIGLIKIMTGSLVDGAGILLVGILLITPIEMILRPKLIGKKSSFHPLAVLIGVIGGIELMGFIGMIYGPLILSIAVTLIEFIEETKNIKIAI